MRTRFPPVAACLGNYACAKVVTRGWKCRWPVDRRRVNYREKLRRAEKLLSIPSEANYRFRCSRSVPDTPSNDCRASTSRGTKNNEQVGKLKLRFRFFFREKLILQGCYRVAKCIIWLVS